MKLYCVGCGPGDPELLTIKAVEAIRKSQMIFAPTAREGKPSIALSIIARYIDKNTDSISLIFPMTKDKESLKSYWRRNADEIAQAVRSGKTVTYLTVGDPSLYSTWIYIHREIKERYSEIEIEIIPGVASMFAFAAQAKMSLAEGEETIAIVPACYDLQKVQKVVTASDSIIFLKDGRYFDSVLEMLYHSGFTDESTIAIAQDLSSENEKMNINKLGNVRSASGSADKYFSIMVAKKKNETK